MKDIPEKEREKFARQMDSDPDHKKRVGETLLIFLDRLDEIEKPDLLALAFKAYVLGRVDFTTFRRLSFAVDRCFTADLRHLPSLKRPVELPPDAALSLAGAGFLELSTMPAIRSERQHNQYQVTEFGRLFVEVVLEAT